MTARERMIGQLELSKYVNRKTWLPQIQCEGTEWKVTGFKCAQMWHSVVWWLLGQSWWLKQRRESGAYWLDPFARLNYTVEIFARRRKPCVRCCLVLLKQEILAHKCSSTAKFLELVFLCQGCDAVTLHFLSGFNCECYDSTFFPPTSQPIFLS